MKIYRVVFKRMYLDEGENKVRVTTFLNKELAEEYLKERIKDLKSELEILDQEGYITEEEDNYYERYLDGYAIEDSVAIWLEEDDTYDEKMIKEKAQKKEKENNYEM